MRGWLRGGGVRRALLFTEEIIQFVNNIWSVFKNLESVESGDVLFWYIGWVMFKAAMNEEIWVNGPARMSESLDWRELVPLAGLSVVEFKCYLFIDWIGATSYYNHHSSHEDWRMLVSLKRSLSCLFVRSLHPVPSTISMSSQSPGVVKSGSVSLSSSKYNHHSSSRARRT